MLSKMFGRILIFFTGLFIGVFYLFSNKAQAFHINDHGLITSVAVAEYNACDPAYAFSPADTTKLKAANLDEDLNILRKWVTYSHYYNPTKHLDMSRKDSSVRVSELEIELLPHLMVGPPPFQLSRADILRLMGHAIHHLQDMAVPAHVVPISHRFSENFELMTAKTSDWDAHTSMTDCGALLNAPSLDLLDLLKEYANLTLLRLQYSFEYERDHAHETGNWGLFWKPSDGLSFGNYGAAGDHFGLATFTHGDHKFRLNPLLYEQFHHEQLRRAIEATKRALYWMNHQHQF